MSKNNVGLPSDRDGNKFFSTGKPGTPLIVAITAAGFSAVTLASAVKAIHISTADEANFLLSDISAGTTFCTMKSGMYMDIQAESGDIIFYVKGTSSTNLEILPFD